MTEKNYNISQLLHYTTRAITDIILVDLGKDWLPSNSLGLRPGPLLGKPNFPAVYNVGYCPCMSAITYVHFKTNVTDRYGL